jgi:hypothetical protein
MGNWIEQGWVWGQDWGGESDHVLHVQIDG